MPPDIYSYQRTAPEWGPLSPEEEGRLSELGARFDELEVESGGELTEEQGAELDQIEEEIATIQERQVHYSAEARAQSGVFVTFGGGGIEVQRGWLRPEVRQNKSSQITNAESDKADDGEHDAHEGQNEAEPAKQVRALSAVLIDELLAHRTAGLQVEVARRPDLALRVLLHSLILDTMHQDYRAPCKISVREPQLRAVCPSIDETPARKELTDLKSPFAAWKLPDADALLPWLMTRGNDEILEMLAVLVAHGMDAGRANWTTLEGAQDAAAQAAGFAELDMRQWWKPNTESYFGRVPKFLILEAMREGASDGTVKNSGGEKKATLAASATVLLDGKGWLPVLLRRDQPEKDAPANAA